MQAVPQGVRPPEQVKPQLVPSQVGLPLVGAVQGEHDVGPQELIDWLLTQLVLQMWYAAEQAPANAQVPFPPSW
jgi:hypothetical protein